MLQQIQSIWNGILGFTAIFVIPDWKDPIAWLPVLLAIGVVGPILSLLVLAWFVYVVRRPRAKVAFAETRRAAPLDSEGRAVFPTGEPYSLSEGMIYEAGATRSAGGESLVVACPKCSLVRPAGIDTCGNCGLSFTLKAATRSLRPAGPPPGGAAAA
jgi:hypothetical protein